MQRSSHKVGTLAAALAKAQARPHYRIRAAIHCHFEHQVIIRVAQRRPSPGLIFAF